MIVHRKNLILRHFPTKTSTLKNLWQMAFNYSWALVGFKQGEGPRRLLIREFREVPLPALSWLDHIEPSERSGQR